MIWLKPGMPFPTVIGRTVDVSSLAWPQQLHAKPGAPNALFIVQDDTGFGQIGCFGGRIRTGAITLEITSDRALAEPRAIGDREADRPQARHFAPTE
jgi:hypothetical protein